LRLKITSALRGGQAKSREGKKRLAVAKEQVKGRKSLQTEIFDLGRGRW